MSNATGQQLQDWQKKIIGRKDRWTIYTNVVEGAMQQGGADAIGSIKDDAPKMAREAVRNATAFQRPVQVMGKTFAPGIRYNWVRRGIKWVAGGLTSVATGYGAGKIEKALREGHPADRVYEMTTADVKFNLLKSSVYPSEELIAQLESRTGYRFDGKAFTDRLEAAIDQAGGGFYDNVWRTELMPHIIRTLFLKELEKMHNEIAKQAEKKGITSEELLDDTLATGTDLMKQILEGYTTELADKTELLGSPIRFTKESPAHTAAAPENMSDDEKKRWDNHVKDTKNVSFLITESELRTMRNNAIKAHPLKSTARMLEDFQTRMPAAPAQTGAQAGAQADINSEEATRAILEIREIKKRYSKRGFFNRFIFHRSAAQEEQRAIAQMTERLKAKYPAADVDRCINDPNYMAGKGGNVSAKQVYKLADVSPRSLRAQAFGDRAYAYANKGVEIIGNVASAAKNVVVYGTIIGTGLVTGVYRGARDAIKKWRNNGDVPEENRNDADEKAGEKEDVKEDVKKQEGGEKEPERKEPEKKEPEKKEPEKKESLPEIDDDFKNVFGDEDDEEILGFKNTERREEPKIVPEKKEENAGKNVDEPVDMDEDGDIFEDALEDPREPAPEEKQRDQAQNPQDGNREQGQQQEQQQQQGWGAWAWGGVKNAAGYVGSFFGGGQQEEPKQEVPPKEEPDGEDWQEAREELEEEQVAEERKEKMEDRKAGEAREIDFAQFQNKVGGPAGKPKEDYAKKRLEIEQAKPGLKLGSVNGQPVSQQSQHPQG